MEELMNFENKWSDSADAVKVEGAVRRIEVEEVLCAMNQIKIGKARGPYVFLGVFSTYKIYIFSNKKFTVTRYLYI